MVPVGVLAEDSYAMVPAGVRAEDSYAMVPVGVQAEDSYAMVPAGVRAEGSFVRLHAVCVIMLNQSLNTLIVRSIPSCNCLTTALPYFFLKHTFKSPFILISSSFFAMKSKKSLLHTARRSCCIASDFATQRPVSSNGF
jgi:hypothetical protein